MCHKNNFNRHTPTGVSKAIVLMTILYSPQRWVTYLPTCACQSNSISAVARDPQHPLDGKQHRTNSTSEEHTRPSFEAEWPKLRLCPLRRGTRTKDYCLPKASPHRELLSGHRDKGVRRERQKDALELNGTRLADAWTKAIRKCKQIIVRPGETESTMLSKDTSRSSAEQNAEQSWSFGIHHTQDLCLTQQLWQGLVSGIGLVTHESWCDIHWPPVSCNVHIAMSRLGFTWKCVLLQYF